MKVAPRWERLGGTTYFQGAECVHESLKIVSRNRVWIRAKQKTSQPLLLAQRLVKVAVVLDHVPED